MTFDQLEVGRHYWASYRLGEPKIYQFRELGGRHCMRGLDGGDYCIEMYFTDIRPVWTPEQCEKLVMIQEKARAVMEWYDRDGSVGGAIDPMDQLRAALAAVGE